MFELVGPEHRLRPAVESTIRSAFHRGHDARLTTLPHWLVARVDDTGVIGAASLRFAEDGFFSEHYLDQPVERAIAQQTGTTPDRRELAEVGGLAAGRPGEIRDMIGGIVGFLQDRGMRWAFFTATIRLRFLLRRTGIPLIDLATADPARIEAAESWGRYYQQQPRVVAVGDDRLRVTFHPAHPVPGGHVHV
ncbi:MAG: thermostable hemolysin [Azospirillaceae bacterium]|nr:thermostable hemolysin [Azospirillaceae bacterium]